MADEFTDVFKKVSFLHTHRPPPERGSNGRASRAGAAVRMAREAPGRRSFAQHYPRSDQGRKLASKYQRAIAAIFGFRVDAQQWQTGSAADFKNWYLASHPAPSPATFEPKLETGVGLKAICMAETPPFDSQLASIDFSRANQVPISHGQSTSASAASLR